MAQVLRNYAQKCSENKQLRSYTKKLHLFTVTSELIEWL